MTIQDLIDQLKTYPPEMLVVIEDRPVIVFGVQMEETELHAPKLKPWTAFEEGEEPVAVLLLHSVKDR